MILVDTSIWVDHLRRGDPTLSARLLDGQVLGHPAVLGELALGQLSERGQVLGLLANLPQAVAATDTEVSALIDNRRLFGRDIGFVDVHLLAATVLTPGARLWTRDRRLRRVATELDVHASDGDV